MEVSVTHASHELPTNVWIDESVDPHDHLRDLAKHGDGRMEMSVPLALGEHGIIVSIGNNARTVTDQATADAHIKDAYSCIPNREHEITIFAAPLVTDSTTPAMVLEMRTRVPRTVAFAKIFLFGASNDAGKSVKDLAAIDETIEATYRDTIVAPPLPVHIHAEEKWGDDRTRIPMRDREIYAMEYRVAPFIRRHPGGVFVIKHVSDKRTFRIVRKLRAEGYLVYAEICTHYLCRCHNDLYEGPGGGTAFNANDFCLPIFKDEDSMATIIEEALEPEDWKFFGSDRAVHLNNPTQSSGVKINDEGIVCGGVFILPAVGKSLLIDHFASAGKLANLNAFVSTNARRVHGFPDAVREVRYVRKPWEVPMRIYGTGPSGEQIEALPFMRGLTMNWQRAD